MLFSLNTQMGFRDSLEEVYKSNNYPLRQPRMKYALDTDCSKMEKEVSRFSSQIVHKLMYIATLMFSILAYLFSSFLFQFCTCSEGITREVSNFLCRWHSCEIHGDMFHLIPRLPVFRLQMMKRLVS